jgi:hypothetical protein
MIGRPVFLRKKGQTVQRIKLGNGGQAGNVLRSGATAFSLLCIIP